jgi:hypothetical protein
MEDDEADREYRKNLIMRNQLFNSRGQTKEERKTIQDEIDNLNGPINDYLKVKYGTGVKEIVNAVSKFAPTSASASVKSFMSKYGEYRISSITVCRVPILGPIQKIITLLRKVTFQEAHPVYDKLFHLYMVVKIYQGSDQKTVKVERNETFQISLFGGTHSKDSECRPAGVPKVTFQDFIMKPAIAQGPSFWTYDAVNNNCQDALLKILSSNSVLTDSLRTFIKQDTKNLLGKFTKLFGDVGKRITDVAGAVSHHVLGKGRKRKLIKF